MNVFTRTIASRNDSFCRYRESVQFVDSQMRRVFQLVNVSAGVLVVTGDHGEELFDHGSHGHSADIWWEERVNVPLLICLPERSHKRAPRSEAAIILTAGQAPISSHVDVLPTVISAIARGAHLDATLVQMRDCSHGQPLLHFLASDFSTPDVLVQREPFRLIFGRGEKLVIFDNDHKAILEPECTTSLPACLRLRHASLVSRATDTLVEEGHLPVSATLERHRESALSRLRKVCSFNSKVDRPVSKRASLASGLVAQLRDIGVSKLTVDCIASALRRHSCEQLSEMPLLLECASGAITALCASAQTNSLLEAMQGA